VSAISEDGASRGALAASVSNGMVGLLHRYTGRGPTKARTTISENLVVCVLGATLTHGEQILVDEGKDKIVLRGRRAFQAAMEDDAVSLVEDLLDRDVVAFMSNNHIDPDLAVEIFILAPLDGE
jgi:uncharacterized protein YbcI